MHVSISPRRRVNDGDMSIDVLARKLGYTFGRPELLREALTHRSYGSPNNERLEFLGDAILNCATAVALFEKFPKLPEGDLSRLRANLVNKQVLFELAQPLGLGDFLKLGEGELKSGGHQRPSILADALEALIGAVYLDGGFGEAQQLVQRLLGEKIAAIDPQHLGKDAKTVLQEYLQSKRMALPKYSVIETRGEAHEQTFQVECAVAELSLRSQAEGASRRAAEQQAAALLLEQIKGV
jgi:ribonuclease-3